MAKKKQQQQQIGSLEMKKSDSGLIYLKGNVFEDSYIAFKASKEWIEKHPKAPTYSGYEDLDYEEGEKRNYNLSLWSRTSKQGNKYLSGLVEGMNIVAFYDEDTSTFRVYESRPVEKKTTKKKPADELPF